MDGKGIRRRVGDGDGDIFRGPFLAAKRSTHPMVGRVRRRRDEAGFALLELLIAAAIIAVIIALAAPYLSDMYCTNAIRAIRTQLAACELALMLAQDRGVPGQLGTCVTDVQRLIKRFANHEEWWPSQKGAIKDLWVAFKGRYDPYRKNNPEHMLPEALDQPIYIPG
jgi:prepilin-type N-terminal cleavage/methylation domain-containing protein